MKQAQFILYNQLRESYLQEDIDCFLYVHHIWKIIFQGKELKLNTKSKILDYAGGKDFVDELKKNGNTAEFVISKDFFHALEAFTKKHDIEKWLVVKPVEDYVYKNILKLSQKLKKVGIEMSIVPDTESFFLSHEDFQKQYKKPPIMEYFYRFMRKKENILMTADWEPEWGEWNYDKENRKFDKKHEKIWDFSLKKTAFLEEAWDYYDTDISSWIFPINRQTSLDLLEYFLEKHIDRFWVLEDAMYQDDPYVHHSLLSTAINFWFLSPREVVERIAKTDTAMNNKEGFIRQILWWREYMYHFFQFYKESIYEENFLDHQRKLPDFFWTDASTTSMNCLQTTLRQVQTENFSHHIQRLMIIGNYALLANLNPHELNKWFFEYYVDAFEWVVTPNVLGMSQFADGWKLATKPYVASANYINKMSDYCKNCKYNPKEKYTEDACPFNYLYWNFVHDNKSTFEKWRQQFVVRNLEKIDREKIQELKKAFLK